MRVNSRSFGCSLILSRCTSLRPAALPPGWRLARNRFPDASIRRACPGQTLGPSPRLHRRALRPRTLQREPRQRTGEQGRGSVIAYLLSCRCNGGAAAGRRLSAPKGGDSATPTPFFFLRLRAWWNVTRHDCGPDRVGRPDSCISVTPSPDVTAWPPRHASRGQRVTRRFSDLLQKKNVFFFLSEFQANVCENCNCFLCFRRFVVFGSLF